MRMKEGLWPVEKAAGCLRPAEKPPVFAYELKKGRPAAVIIF
jgi:hypothetical protein